MKPLSMALVAVLTLVTTVAQADEARIAASRATVAEFFGALKGELTQAMESGGAAAAITVCNTRAPAIAQEVSNKKGWTVGRTSLKVRNPANAPDAWEKKVLEQFEARLAAGEKLDAMEYTEVTSREGKKVFRYMKAIPTAEKPCLVCHGATLAPPVAEALKGLYPEDKATGYQAGQLRGAFTITQPME